MHSPGSAQSRHVQTVRRQGDTCVTGVLSECGEHLGLDCLTSLKVPGKISSSSLPCGCVCLKYKQRDKTTALGQGFEGGSCSVWWWEQWGGLTGCSVFRQL